MCYNAVLRGSRSENPYLRSSFQELCGPPNEDGEYNMFTSTIHCINSAVVKLSKLTQAGPVYRGVSGGLLPDKFWQKDEFGLKCGVELGLMSVTRERAVAVDYATLGRAPSVVLSSQLGMVDRGADIEFISQYPHEREILLPPLTGVQVLDGGMRVDRKLLLVDVRLSSNLVSQTIEQVLSRRKFLVEQMLSQLEAELLTSLEKHAPGFCEHFDKAKLLHEYALMKQRVHERSSGGHSGTDKLRHEAEYFEDNKVSMPHQT